jgi:hypothetical protein
MGGIHDAHDVDVPRHRVDAVDPHGLVDHVGVVGRGGVRAALA